VVHGPYWTPRVTRWISRRVAPDVAMAITAALTNSTRTNLDDMPN